MRTVCTSQHSAEWMQARTGNVTASRMADAKAKYKIKSKAGDWTQAHWKYVSELAWERITGVSAEHYVSKPMEIGSQFEGEARVEYWLRYGTEVEQTGFVLHPRFDFLGASPDGLVGSEGGVEIKVPLFHNHVAYLEADAIPDDYQDQMYTNMLCCERKWWDFVSYCPPDIAPELPDEFRMFKRRLEADQTMFDAIEEAATATMQHVTERMETLRRMYPAKSALKSKNNVEWERSVEALEASEDVNDFTGKAYEFLDSREMVP